jgi:serine/threonine protein kinase
MDLYEPGVYGTRIANGSSTPLDTNGITISPGGIDAYEPTVASNGSGFLVAWQRRLPFDPQYTICAARVTGTGVVTDPASLAVTDLMGPNDNAMHPAVASNGTDYLVVWEDYRGTDHAIYGSLVPSSGSIPVANGFLIADAPMFQTTPAVASNGVTTSTSARRTTAVAMRSARTRWVLSRVKTSPVVAGAPPPIPAACWVCSSVSGSCSGVGVDARVRFKRQVKPADELRRGDSLGRYEIIERIAVGGMAEVYLGRVRGTAGFDKLVAIKRILPFVAEDSAFVEMFLGEARLAATLRHPNLADVFDVGIDADSYFFAMEFIHGQDLRNVRLEAEAQGGRVPLEIALAITSGVASALAYAHAKIGPTGPLHLVHRDVSPSNILVSYDGAVKLVDFGIARAETNTSATVTRTGQLKGKIPYMSPEQCRAKQLDGRADLFSLGIVLYELTTGERPFDGKGDFDTLERIVHGTMRLPSEIVTGYPRALEQIVLRLLANKRSLRYQTAEELLHDLEAVTSEHGWFASAFMVGKYMRELFGDEAEQIPGIDDEDPPTLSPHTILEVEGTGSFRREATVRVPLAESPPTEELKIVFRVPTSPTGTKVARLETASPFYEESATAQGTEVTHDGFPSFDPITARGSQILAEIDPAIADDREISMITVGELLQRALAWSEAGNLDDAVIAIDLILSADRTTPGMLDILAKNFPFMTAIFEVFLGDRSRILALSQQLDEIADLPLDRRAAYVLTLIDGSMTPSDLVAKADMPIVEAYRHLSLLILRRVVVLV